MADQLQLAAELGRMRQWLLQLDAALFTRLIPEDYLVLRLRYGLDDGTYRSLTEVAADIDRCRERARQRESRGLVCLRSFATVPPCGLVHPYRAEEVAISSDFIAAAERFGFVGHVGNRVFSSLWASDKLVITRVVTEDNPRGCRGITWCSLRQLAENSPHTLLSIRNFGPKCLEFWCYWVPELTDNA